MKLNLKDKYFLEAYGSRGLDFVYIGFSKSFEKLIEIWQNFRHENWKLIWG